MRKCSGNNTQEWDADAIFGIECESCGKVVDFSRMRIPDRALAVDKRFTMTERIMAVGSIAQPHRLTTEIIALDSRDRKIVSTDTNSGKRTEEIKRAISGSIAEAGDNESLLYRIHY